MTKLTISDTVITGIKEKASSVCLVQHCTGSQGCPLCQVCNTSVSTNQNTLPVETCHCKRSAHQQEGRSAKQPSCLSLWLQTQYWKMSGGDSGCCRWVGNKQWATLQRGGWAATAVTCEGSGTCHILLVFVCPFSSFLFLFAFSFQPLQQVSWLYIHMSDAPQTSSQHILYPALMAWFSTAAWWRLWFGWDGTPGFRPRSNLHTSPAAHRRGCRCAPPLSGTPAPLPPASQWSGRSCDPTLLGTSTLQLYWLCLPREDSVQVRAADEAPPQSGWQDRVSFRDVCEWREGVDGSRRTQ